MRPTVFILYLLVGLSAAGQYPPHTKTVNNPIHADSSIIISWATTVRLMPGYLDISDREAGRVDVSDSVSALGHADKRTISLGDSGVAVVGFSIPIMNTAGPDFAVFENSFDGKFLELAQVEVSSDSIRWVKFHSVSLTDTLEQIGTFGNIESGNIKNLAGKHRALYGTSFDLEELKDSIGIDIMNINYIRLIDVIGRIDHPSPVRSSDGRIINDPWPTPFETSGFDLDAVAVLGSGVAVSDSRERSPMKIYPNPSNGIINIEGLSPVRRQLSVISADGRLMRNLYLDNTGKSIDLHYLSPGLYYIVPDNDYKLALPFIINRNQ